MENGAWCMGHGYGGLQVHGGRWAKVVKPRSRGVLGSPAVDRRAGRRRHLAYAPTVCPPAVPRHPLAYTNRRLPLAEGSQS
jgi:hypothetical protein